MAKVHLDEVEDVDIDANGRFKYVLIKLYHPDSEENYKYIVRGYKWAGYHGNRQTRCLPGGGLAPAQLPVQYPGTCHSLAQCQ